MLNLKWITLLLFISAYPALAIAESVYIYVNEHGNKVFTDKIPEDQSFTINQLKEVQTTQWQAPSISQFLLKNKNTKSQKDNSTDNSKFCFQLNKQIEAANSALRGKLDAVKFDRIKKQLSEKRWQYQQKC